MDKIQFSKYFTSRRKELGISINDIASVLNVSTAAVYKYEKGTNDGNDESDTDFQGGKKNFGK